MVLLIAFFVVTFFLKENISISNIQLHEEVIFHFVENNFYLTVLLFLIASAFLVNSPVPFATALELIGGYLFGFANGVVFNVIGMVLGSIVGYCLGKYLFKNYITHKFSTTIHKIQRGIKKYGVYYFMTLRFAIAVPYFLINYVAGTSGIKFFKYLISTVIGVIPSAVIYAYGGSTIREIGALDDLFKPRIILILLLLVAFSLAPIWFKPFKRWLSKV